MTQDWQAVATAIADRLDERGMTMTDLAARSGISLTTVRELVHVLGTRRRHPRTLTALSEALGWPADHLVKVLRGGASPVAKTDAEADSDALSSIRAELRELRSRVEALERAMR